MIHSQVLSLKELLRKQKRKIDRKKEISTDYFIALCFHVKEWILSVKTLWDTLLGHLHARNGNTFCSKRLQRFSKKDDYIIQVKNSLAFWCPAWSHWKLVIVDDGAKMERRRKMRRLWESRLCVSEGSKERERECVCVWERERESKNDWRERECKNDRKSVRVRETG